MIDKIKELREKTNISLAACKTALEESGGDISRALEILKKRGLEIAEKKSQRQIKAGIIGSYIHGNKQIGVLVEAMSETDFVAKNDDFQKFVFDMAMHIAASNPKDIAELLVQPYIKDSSILVKDYLNNMIQKFGENIEITRFTRYSLI